MSANAEKLFQAPRSVKARDERSLEIVSQKPERDTEHTMPPRSTDDKVDKLVDVLLAQAVAQNGNGKQNKPMLLSMWFSPLIVVLGIGYSAVSRDNKQQFSVEAVQAQVTSVQSAYQQENTKLWTLIETQRLQIEKLNQDLAILKDRQQRK